MKTTLGRWVFYCLCCLSFNILWGQQDTIVMEDVVIYAVRIRGENIGGQSKKWTSPQLNRLAANNVADLLQQESNTFIKSYGLGSLATSSIRGGSAGHTLVLWNGLPLQSPMLGLLDLSLLHLNTTEEISLQKGGNTSLWGSGAIGGTLNLQNLPDAKNRFQANILSEIGSFGRWQQQGVVKLGNNNFQSHTKVIHLQAENNFQYTIAPDLPKREQSNAQLSQQNFLQNFYWTGEKQDVQAHYWYQQSERQIPPTNVQNISLAHQSDQAHRAVLNWRYYTRNSVLRAKAAWFQENLDYTDDQIFLQSNSQFTTLFAEFSDQWQWRKQQQFYLGTTQSFTTATSAGYNDKVQEHRSAFLAFYQTHCKKWSLKGSLRQEFIDGNSVPLVPSLGFEYQISPQLRANLKISKNYRLPTLNDRFWRPGGNENLLPENGWSEEIGIKSEFKEDNWTLETNTAIFNRNIDNWILWSVQDGQQFWSANNIAKVWSRGLEQRISLENRNWFRLILGYDCIRSTNQIALTLPKIEAGSQLWYTPEHQGFIKASFNWKNFAVSYQHQLVGAALGINENLPAYQIGNARLQYELQKEKYKGQLFLNIYNLWDTDYFIIERRPMPGRHWSTGVRFSIEKLKS
ncbi:MAG: TonB-dependent receptor [Bacteroidota bacterium]